jgi:hypothetical protein
MEGYVSIYGNRGLLQRNLALSSLQDVPLEILEEKVEHLVPSALSHSCQESKPKSEPDLAPAIRIESCEETLRVCMSSDQLRLLEETVPVGVDEREYLPRHHATSSDHVIDSVDEREYLAPRALLLHAQPHAARRGTLSGTTLAALADNGSSSKESDTDNVGAALGWAVIGSVALSFRYQGVLSKGAGETCCLCCLAPCKEAVLSRISPRSDAVSALSSPSIPRLHGGLSIMCPKKSKSPWRRLRIVRDSSTSLKTCSNRRRSAFTSA